MTEWRRRLRKGGKFEGGKLMLFFGARTPQELPYFGPLQSLPRDFIDNNLAFSRVAGQPPPRARAPPGRRLPSVRTLVAVEEDVDAVVVPNAPGLTLDVAACFDSRSWSLS